jgi:DNA-binding PadR family transcriptional regulator
MIKRIKTFMNEAQINDAGFREYVENFESEITRGISTLSILTILEHHGAEGIYGYQLLKELEESTQNMLIIEEGTLYPILKKLQTEGIVLSEKRTFSGRVRNYFILTPKGKQILNHMQGFFTRLVESMSGLMEYQVNTDYSTNRAIFCPNCANRIEIEEQGNYCPICGLNIEGLKGKTHIFSQSNKEVQK